ncbi:MAG: alanine--tRNA ligase [Thermomicrobiales bacterium]
MNEQSFGFRYLTGNEVRRAFVDFFVARGHREMASSSLVPHNDPTVLLTTAGMQQMTPFFLGLETPPAVRLCSVQKCFRTDDIDEVGDESHNTFFFMLGNFSVGDYFKQQALAWTWEFFTEVMGLPGERLYPTVHPTDEESYRIWRDEIGVPAERIVKLEDNWWGPVGPTGPNGPDSEVYFDRGEEHGCGRPECAPGCDCERFLETWNNVFMEFYQAADGSRTPLPRPCVDTGLGLERLTLLMQRANSIFDTDIFQEIIQRAATLAKTTYGVDEEHDRALRVIADHIRGGTFLIADGVLPGNEARSYILRRILRRAVRHGRGLGLDKPFLAQLAGVVIDQFGDDYPELRQRRGQIERVLTHEEESFGRTLNTGISRFQTLVDDLRREAPTDGERVAPLVLPGAEAFRLHDTYGFPFDLTVELAREHGISVDQAGFNEAMEAQRATSRGGAAFKDAVRGRAELYVSLAGQQTEFLGFDQTAADATILAFVGPDGAIDEAEAGQAVEVILDRTPFYGESGGQIGDTGHIRTETGLIEIEDTFKPTPELIVHRGIVAEGFVRTGEQAHAEIDAARRQAIRRNHTATHLLHRALRIVLGDETHQAGSLVAPDRLRFDFTSLDPMGQEQVQRVAEIVNHQIIADREVTAIQKSYSDAVADGAMALFGEKYGDVVRVVAIPGFSQELCGGTHVGHTGEIGPFLIVSEGSISSGIRRIEALTGEGAIGRMLAQQRVLEGVARDLRVAWSDVPAQIGAAHDRSRTFEREVERLRGQLAGSRAADLLDRAVAVDGTRVLAARVEVESKDGLRQMGDRLRDRLTSGVIVLGTVIDGQPSLLSIVTPDVVQRGVRAGDLVREAATIIDGRGGGRPELAEAGGKDASKLDAALAAVPEIVKKAVVGR